METKTDFRLDLTMLEISCVPCAIDVVVVCFF